jgi:hypothetical protein
MIGETLCFWVITRRPLDFPEHYAMRRQLVLKGRIAFAQFAGVYDTLEEARKDIPQGLYCLGRDPNDDPVIVESWI